MSYHDIANEVLAGRELADVIDEVAGAAVRRSVRVQKEYSAAPR
jgi:hypothetical protein